MDVDKQPDSVEAGHREPVTDVMRNEAGRFVPGHKKIPLSGSVKGRISKFNWQTRQVFEEKKCHPLALALDVILTGLLPVAHGEDPKRRKPVSPEERLRMLREVLAYALPKLSSTQISGTDGGPINVAALDVTQLMSDPTLAAMAQKLSLAATSLTATYTEPLGDPDQDPDQ